MHHPVISIEEGDGLSPETRSRNCIYFPKTVLIHCFDFFRIALPLQAQMARWLQQLFLELARYDRAPSTIAQRSWLGVIIIGCSMGTTLMIKIIHHTHERRKRDYLALQDYIFAALSSANVYRLLDIAHKSGNAGSIPLPWFIGVSVGGLLTATALMTKIAAPDSTSPHCNHLTCGLDALDRLDLPQFLDASVSERFLNACKLMLYAAVAAVAFFWTVNREVRGETVPVAAWQIGLISLLLVLASYAGFQLNRHPKFAYGFLTFLKILRDGSLAYGALSGIVYMIVVYAFHCPNYQFCLNDTDRRALTYFCFIAALATGLFSGAASFFDFQDNHIQNQKLIAMKNGTVDALKIAGNYAVTLFAAGKNYLSRVCAHSDHLEASPVLNRSPRLE